MGRLRSVRQWHQMTVNHTAGIFTRANYGDRLCTSRAGERASHGAHHVNNDRTCAWGGRGCDITAPINSEPQRADQHSAISVPTSVRQSLPSTRPTCGESGAVDSLLCDLCGDERAAIFTINAPHLWREWRRGLITLRSLCQRACGTLQQH
jgi:hypothetical protein